MLAPAPLYTVPNSTHLMDFSSKLSYSQRWIIQAALRRGLQVEMLDSKLYRLSDGAHHVDMTLGMSTRIPHVTRLLTNSKSVSKSLMARHGLPVPVGQKFMPTDVEAAWEFASDRLPVVVKPAVGSFSKNVTVRVLTEADFRAAFAQAAQGRRFQVIIEEYIAGFDYRILVIGGQVRACIWRRYASVQGDGVQGIPALIDAKNIRRATHPMAAMNPIPHKPGVHYDHFPDPVDYTSVPDAGQRVFLRDDNFVFEGHDLVSCIEDIHPEFARIALRAHEIFGDMPSFGLDVLTPDITAHPKTQRWAVCEINLNSSHVSNHLPGSGPARDTAGCIVEDLFPNATLAREAAAPQARITVSLFAPDPQVITPAQTAIALHALHITAQTRDDSHCHYDLTGPDFLVHGYADWLAQHCAPHDYEITD